MKEFAFEDVDGYTITIARKWDEPLFPAGGGWRFSCLWRMERPPVLLGSSRRISSNLLEFYLSFSSQQVGIQQQAGDT